MKKTITLLTAFALFLRLGVQQSWATPTACTSIGGNLVSNCAFGTGSFSGWTVSGNDVPGELNNLYGVEGTDPIDGIAPIVGSDQAYIADLTTNATTLSQTFSTVASDSYLITFYLAQDTASTPEYGNELAVDFGGSTIASYSDIPVEGYTEYTYIVTATSANTTFSLTLGDGLGEELLDNVSVARTPEPSSMVLLATGLAGLGWLGARRRLAV